jgi:integrase
VKDSLIIPQHEIYNDESHHSWGLSMAGKIRTREKCLTCKKAFVIKEEENIHCPDCNTRPKTFYIFLYYDKGKYRISRDTDGHILDSYKRAHRLLEAIRREIDQGIFSLSNYLPKEIERFRGKVLFPKWFEVKVSEGRAPSHIREIERYVRLYYKPFFTMADMRKIKAGDIEDFYMNLPGHLSPKTKKNILIELRAFLNWLYKREIIARIPAFPKVDVPEPSINPIDRTAQLKILSHVKSWRLRDIIEFLIHHPVRPGEARALQVEDILVNEHKVWIRKTFSMKTLKGRKNKNAYVLPLTPYFVKTLERLCKDKLPKAFVFVNQYGNPFSNESLEVAWNRAKEKAGLGHLKTPLYQGTRHSWGTKAVNDGIALNLIQGAMGSSTSQSAKRYARLKAEGLRQILERMQGSNAVGAQMVQS